MENLQEWLSDTIEGITQNRSQMEIDRLLLQGRVEALQAVQHKLSEMANEDTKSEGQTEQGKSPAPVAAPKVGQA